MHRVVPELIIEKFKAGQFHGEFPAVGMFLDLSGFSTMTDALMQHGQHGAEVLASLMHGVFDPLVESIFEHGGKIVGFAGDGIMALYPFEEDARITALRALASADLIQNRLEQNPARQTVYGKFPIFAKIGLTCGSVTWGILLSYQGDQATYYFRGSAVDDAAHAEQHAKPGEILLTRNLAILLASDIRTTPAQSNSSDVYQRFSAFDIEPPGSIPVSFPPIDLEVSRLFMPAEVISHDVRGEFRQVVNLFMRLPELNDEQMRTLTREVFDLRDKYGGLLTRVDFGDKGCNMLILWGAPVAYENDIGRALNFLIDLKARVDFPITAGVTYYIAHAGYLGSTLCEDYTCYGWGVNLASRFMTSAPTGEIWVDDRISRRVARRFEIEFVGSQHFKGFAAEQKVHRLQGHRKILEPIYQGELVGRDAELEQLRKFIEPLWQNKFAGLLLVSGDAGIGKGRLVYEFRSSEVLNDHAILWAVCQSDQVLRQSFNPLRGWLLHYFNFSVDESLDERRQKFEAKLDELLASIPDLELAEELERTRSILGSLLDLRWPDSLYEQLDAEGRYNNTFLALMAFLKAESLRQPVVIFLEDLQFTDNESKDFLPRLKRSILASQQSYPIAMIVTTRPHAVTLEPEIIDEQINLQGLSQEAIARLAENILGGSASPELVTLLWSRSEGNPYFTEQIVRYLQEDNFLETSAAGWSLVKRLRMNFLPSDIRAVLVARLDQLTRAVKEIIQTASVLGREFELKVLLNMIRIDGDIQEYIAEAERAVIWSPLNEIRYIFTHGLLRDAAYEMQMRARRQELHALAVDALERLYQGETMKSHYAELAHHAEYAGFADKALRYYTRAGKESAQSYQNHQAIDYFTRAITLAPVSDLGMQFDLTAERVELYNRLGKRDLQSKDLATLESLAKQMNDDLRLTKTWLLYITFWYLTGKYAEALEYGQRAFSSPVVPVEPELIFGARITWFLSVLRLGRAGEAMQLGQETLTLVRETHSRRQLGRVLSAIGLVAFEQKEASHAESYYKEALDIAHELKDRNLESRALNNLAIFEAGVNGDYARAYDYYQQVLDLAHMIGDRNAESFALANLGFASGMLGNLPEAKDYLEQALGVARESGNVYSEITILTNLSANTAIQKQLSLARKYAQGAVELAEKAGDASGEAWGWLYLGHAQLLLDEIEKARKAFAKSIEIREKLGQPALATEPMAGLVEADLCQGDLEMALAGVEEILAHLQSGGTLNGTDEPLRVYYNCFQLLEKKEDPRSAQVLQMGIQLLRSQVSKFKDHHARTMYVENVPWRLALQEAGRKAGLL